MREYAGAWKRSAAMIAQMSAQRLQDQLEHEREAGMQQRLSRRIVELTKIAQALDAHRAGGRPASGAPRDQSALGLRLPDATLRYCHRLLCASAIWSALCKIVRAREAPLE